MDLVDDPQSAVLTLLYIFQYSTHQNVLLDMLLPGGYNFHPEDTHVQKFTKSLDALLSILAELGYHDFHINHITSLHIIKTKAAPFLKFSTHDATFNKMLKYEHNAGRAISALHLAAACIDPEYLCIMLARSKHGYNNNNSISDSIGRAPLHVAVLYDLKENAWHLLFDVRDRADPNQMPKYPQPYHKKRFSEKIIFNMVRLLLKGKKSHALSVFETEGATPLMLAIANESKDMVNLLLNEGADPNISPINIIAPLKLAVADGNRAIVKTLLRHGANPNTLDCNMLHYAIEAKQFGLIDLILPHIRDLNEIHNGKTAYEHMEIECVDDHRLHPFLNMIAYAMHKQGLFQHYVPRSHSSHSSHSSKSHSSRHFCTPRAQVDQWTIFN